MGCFPSKNREDDSPPAPHPTKFLSHHYCFQYQVLKQLIPSFGTVNNGNLSEFRGRSIADMGDAELGRLVDGFLEERGEQRTYEGDAQVFTGEDARDLDRQFFMASLRHNCWVSQLVSHP
jgi:hypothetical protein